MSAADGPCSRPTRGIERTASRPSARRVGGTARPGGGATAPSPEDAAAIALLAEILVGERTWSLAEVGRLVVLRDLVDRSRLDPMARGEVGPDAG